MSTQAYKCPICGDVIYTSHCHGPPCDECGCGMKPLPELSRGEALRVLLGSRIYMSTSKHPDREWADRYDAALAALAAAPAPAAINPPLADSKLRDVPALEREAVPRKQTMATANLLAASMRLVGIVEGFEGAGRRWAANGERLKDTPEWVALYNAVNDFNERGGPPAEAREPVGDAEMEAWQSAREDAHEAASYYGNDPRVASRIKRAAAWIEAHPPSTQPRDTPRDSGDAVDAARYRFLRNPANSIVYAMDWVNWNEVPHSGRSHFRYEKPEQLDAAIDAQLAAMQSPTGEPT